MRSVRSRLVASLILVLSLDSAAHGIVRTNLMGAAITAQSHHTASPAFQHSLRLDGDLDYVQVADDLALTPPSAMTIEAWVRRSNSDRCEAIVGKGVVDSYWLGFCNHAIAFYSGGLASLQEGSTTVPANVWTHIAVVWQSGGQRRYYINGDLDYTGAAGTAPTSNSQPLWIGADPQITVDYFYGNIAEVRLWNVARTLSEIRRTMHVALEEPLPGLVANWHFSDDYKDNIGSHHGTNHNADLLGPQAPPRPAVAAADKHFNELTATRYGAATAYVSTQNRAILAGGVRGGAASNQIDAVDASTGALDALGTLPGNRIYAAAAYAPANATVYVFGGNSDVLGLNYANTIYAIDPNTGDVRTLAATLPTARTALAAVYHSRLNRIYVLGGRTSSTVLSSIAMFNPFSETLTSPLSFSLPAARSRAAAVYSSLTDKVYLFGGGATAGGEEDTIFEISLNDDGVSGSARQLTPRLPNDTAGLTAVEDPITGLIYLLGGSNADRVIVFDPVTSQVWQTMIEMPADRTFPSTVYSVQGRHAVLIGGYEGSALDDMWRIPLGNGPAVSLGQWDFPTSVSQEVTAIDGDDRRVVVGTRGAGLWRYNSDGTRTPFSAAALGSASGIVNDVRYDAANNDIWVATDDAGGKLIAADGTMTTFDSAVLGTDRVLAVDVMTGSVSGESVPFFGTWDQGLRWRDRILFPPPGSYVWRTSFANQEVKAVALRPSGDLWAIANGGLKRLQFDAFFTETDYSGNQCGLFEPNDLAFGPNGDWWIVSPNLFGLVAQGITGLAPSRQLAELIQGVCRIPGAIVPGVGMQEHEPRIGTAATAVDVDADGRVWVAVKSQDGESGGLVVYQAVGSPPAQATMRTDEHNWLTATLGSRTAILADGTAVWNSGFTAVGAADERVWAGKGNGRLVTLAQRWQQLDESNSLDTKAIAGVWLARGRAFLATSNSLHVLAPDGQTWDNRDSVQALAVLGDSRGRIWVGTGTDVRLYTPAGWDLLDWAEGAPPAGPVYALAEDRSGRIWIGGAGGLTLFDRERFVATFTAANSDLPDDHVRALLADDDYLWVGTDDGLARFDGSTWQVYGTTDGLPSAAIRDLAQLGDGTVAASTAGGLGLYDGTSFETETLPVSAANLPLTVDQVGRLWAGSAVRTANGWRGYWWTNSGLRSSTVADNAADGADRVWFSHSPASGVSVRGAFLPPLGEVIPTITQILLDHGYSGQTIGIFGTGFGSNPADVSVTVGGAPVELVSVSDTSIRVRLGDHNVSGDVSVSIGGRRTTYVRADRPAFCAEPVIHNVTPTGGNAGVMVDITGSNFDPAATIRLGDQEYRNPIYRNPTHLQFIIQPSDATGVLRVRNHCPGGATYADAAPLELRNIGITVESIVLNQGILSEGLVADRPTHIQTFVGRSVPEMRANDRLEVDTVEVTFTGDGSVTYRIPYTPTVPSSFGPPSAAQRRNVDNSINVYLTPEVGDWVSLLGSELDVQVVLRRRGNVLAEGARSALFRPNLPLRVLLVPILQDGYGPVDLFHMRRNVDNGLDELRRRIMPTGRVEFEWSSTVLTSQDQVDLGNPFELLEVSHDLDRARQEWNERYDPDMLIAFGVVDRRLRTGDTNGFGFWPDPIQMLNVIALDALDIYCEVGDAVVTALTLGLVDVGDCEVEIPLYVGWAVGRVDPAPDSTQYSLRFGHEIGHILGLVKPDALNGSPFDNLSHSVNDELDHGDCGDQVHYNVDKTLYRQWRVEEPVVNPITGQQLQAQLDVESPDPDGGDPGEEYTLRGKSLMSYACEREDRNVFFEPVDVIALYEERAMASVRNLVHDLRPGSGPSAALESSRALTGRRSGGPAATSGRHIPGTRLYVSGVVSRTTETGRLQRVHVLGENGPLSLSFVTGYWLVQLDASGRELARTGIFPAFSVPDNRPNEVGFFAATILRQPDVARLELRYGDTALDTWSAGNAIPSVSVTGPAGGTYSSGSIPVTWTASDADGDTLEVVIDYSADGGVSWSPVAFSAGSGTVQVPVAQLAGSSNARFRVAANDGLNRGSATSAVFTVASQPPRPYIGYPVAGSAFLEGRRIVLSGGAADNQDRSVAGANLTWWSSRDGKLGTGAELGVVFSVGTHTITLQAQNSAGLSATVSLSVTVQGDYDLDGIQDREELDRGLSPLTAHDAYSDADGDGLPLIVEIKRNTDPNRADSDGDGRDDGDEVAAGTDPASTDAPLPPDRLAVSPAGLSFHVDLGVDIPLSQQAVQVVSRELVSWTLTADVGWLAATTAVGSTPANVTILVKAYGLSDGVHQGVLTFTAPALGSAVTVPVTVSVTNQTLHFDVNRDDVVNVLDLQEVIARVGTDNTQPDFSYRHDVDRDGDVDQADVHLIASVVLSERVYLPVVLR